VFPRQRITTQQQRNCWKRRSLCGQCRGYIRRINWRLWVSPCVGSGFEYLHCSPASRSRRRKGNLVPWGITGPPSSWATGTWHTRLGESIIWNCEVWSWIESENDCAGEDQQQLYAIDLSSRHRGCYIRTMPARVQLKKNDGRESQGAWRQDELIGGKPTVVKKLWHWLWLWSHTSSNMAYYKIPHEEGRTKGTDCYSWSFSP
jgi:hypothetical protein